MYQIALNKQMGDTLENLRTVSFLKEQLPLCILLIGFCNIIKYIKSSNPHLLYSRGPYLPVISGVNFDK